MSFHNRHSKLHSRLRSRRARDRAFTLVELLVVCAILGVLMSMVLFALQSATETARRDRTRAEIAKINELLMARYEGYRTRPMPMRIPGGTHPNTAASQRLWMTWELMRMELPERISDIERDAAYLKQPDGSTKISPALWTAYRRKLVALTGAPAATPTSAWTSEYSNAECLYLILSTIRDGESSGLDFFTPREIGDLDGDKVPEILDGWGRPIRFLRWAPGYCSVTNGTSVQRAAPTVLQTGVPATQPDPYDPFKFYPTHYALTPLIYSAGPDANYGVKGDDTGSPIIYAATNPFNDPFASLSQSPAIGGCIQENGKDTYIDNITNHLNVTP